VKHDCEGERENEEKIKREREIRKERKRERERDEKYNVCKKETGRKRMCVREREGLTE
jgi:hypothetical protein